MADGGYHSKYPTRYLLLHPPGTFVKHPCISQTGKTKTPKVLVTRPGPEAVLALNSPGSGPSQPPCSCVVN